VAAYSDEVTLISSGGMVLRTAVDDIPRVGRATRGARVMELKKGDEVTSVAVVVIGDSDGMGGR
jgi:DNA gyrase/topoisomerase IV subunit A